MGKSSGISLAKRDDPIFKEGPTFYTRPSDRNSTPPQKTGKVIRESPAGPDDPIYKEGLKVYTPRSARASTTSTKKSPSKQATSSGAASKAPRRPRNPAQDK